MRVYPRMRRGTFRRGAEAIEFALTLPWLLLLMSAIMDFSWFFFTTWCLSASLREGARIGSVTTANRDPASIATREATARGADFGLVWSSAPTAVVVGDAPQRRLELSAQVDVAKLIGLVPLPPIASETVVIRLEDQETALSAN